MAVPNIFANVTTSIPLSQLDQNFATAITLGNTAVYLGNTTTTLGNLTLTNVTISSGTSNLASSSIANGTSNVTVNSSGGNISMGNGGTTTFLLDIGKTLALQAATQSTGAGIAFPANQSASSDANTLDDYEEGTWTPTIASGYTGVTYNSQGGWYTKIGRFVNISGRVQFSGTANNTNIQIGSLPFSQANVGNGAYGGGGIPYCTVAAIVGTSPYVGSSTVDFYTTGTGTQITSGAVNVTNGWISFVITIASAT